MAVPIYHRSEVTLNEAHVSHLEVLGSLPPTHAVTYPTAFSPLVF